VQGGEGGEGESSRRFPQAARLEALRARVLTMDASSLPRPNLSLSAIITPTHSEDELSDRARGESESSRAAAATAKRQTDGNDDGYDPWSLEHARTHARTARTHSTHAQHARTHARTHARRGGAHRTTQWNRTEGAYIGEENDSAYLGGVLHPLAFVWSPQC
jgi:hypothetical protein